MEGFQAAERRAAQERRLQDIAATTKPTKSKQEAFKDVKEQLSALAKLYQHAMGETLFDIVWHCLAMCSNVAQFRHSFDAQWSHHVSLKLQVHVGITSLALWLAPLTEKYCSCMGCLWDLTR